MRVDDLARALRRRDALRSRVLYSRLFMVGAANIEMPQLDDAVEFAIAASIVELIAVRTGTLAPSWTRDIASLDMPFALVTIAHSVRFARLQLETPPELRARNLVAPENFLTSA